MKKLLKNSQRDQLNIFILYTNIGDQSQRYLYFKGINMVVLWIKFSIVFMKSSDRHTNRKFLHFAISVSLCYFLGCLSWHDIKIFTPFSQDMSLAPTSNLRHWWVFHELYGISLSLNFMVRKKQKIRLIISFLFEVKFTYKYWPHCLNFVSFKH